MPRCLRLRCTNPIPPKAHMKAVLYMIRCFVAWKFLLLNNDGLHFYIIWFSTQDSKFNKAAGLRHSNSQNCLGIINSHSTIQQNWEESVSSLFSWELWMTFSSVDCWLGASWVAFLVSSRIKRFSVFFFLGTQILCSYIYAYNYIMGVGIVLCILWL